MTRDLRLIGLPRLPLGFREGLFPHIRPLYIATLGGWRVTRIGVLGSLSALGVALLNPWGESQNGAKLVRLMAVAYWDGLEV